MEKTDQTIENKEGQTLAPCPFCGGSVELWDTSFGIVKVIECKTCNVRFVFKWDYDGEALYKAWARRTQG